MKLDNQQQNEQQNPSLGKAIAKKAGQKATKKVASKLIKKLGKKALLVAGKAVLAALKALAAAALSISLPVLGVIFGVLLVLLLIYIVVMLIFTYDGDSLTGKDAEMREYIIQTAANTIDADHPIESQYPEYAVPYELIVAALQILDSEKNEGYNKGDVDDVAELLAPEFHYKTVELEKETKRKKCKKDGGCSWKTSTSYFDVEVIDYVETWDSYIEFDYEVKWGSWEKISSKKKVREQYTISNVESTELNYTKFEEAMEIDPLKYNTNDKYMVEVLYAVTGKPITYREWKEGSAGFGGGFGGGFGNFNGTLLPGSTIPSEYFPIYVAAANKYNVFWSYVAAIHYVETKFSTIDPMISWVGAEGHTQQMPCTLHGWAYPGCAGSMGYVDIPDNLKYKVSTIQKYGGLGVDANNDGIASPWDIEDALYTTASMLARAGFKTGDEEAIQKAIFSYNHSDKYVADVTKYAQQFASQASHITEGVPNSAGFIQPADGYVSSPFGWRFGGSDWHQGVDIANSQGTPIKAVANGVVSKVITTCSQNSSSNCQGTTYGNYIRVKHVVNGQSYETLYGHLYRVDASIAVGKQVTQGQVIAQMGNSGNSSGPHLHFEIHNGAWSWPPTNAINPALIVPLP